MKRYLIYMFLFCFYFSYRGMALNAPVLRCIEVYNDTEALVTWNHPTDLAGLRYYEIYYSYDNITFTFGERITPEYPSSPDVNSLLHSPVNTKGHLYYYVTAVSTTGDVYKSNVVAAIYFQLTNTKGVAYLDWEPPIIPLLDSYETEYDIYRKKPGKADYSFLKSLSGLSYTDTIDLCGGEIFYKIQLRDNSSASCRNMSRQISDIFYDETSPQTPVLDSVSVDFNTGKTRLGWQRSSSADVTAYIVYNDESGTWLAIDTVYGRTVTTWVDPDRNPADNVYSYRIAALDSCMLSSLMTPQPQKTMKLNGQLNVCAREARISWTPYENMKNGLVGYDIYYAKDGGTLRYEGSVSPTVTSYTIKNLSANSNYSVVVRAKGNTGITASSSSFSFDFSMKMPDHLVNIRYVTVQGEQIELKIITSGDTLPFSKLLLYRGENSETQYSLLAEIPYHPDKNYYFTDLDVQVNQNYYSYKVELIDDCNLLAGTSNVARNILLKGVTNEAHDNTIEWLEYEGWDRGVAQYIVYRKAEIDLSYALLDNISGGYHNRFIDNVSSLFDLGSQFSYYVQARENMNDWGEEECKSNTVTLSQMPTTYIPNAFAPFGVNKLFIPKNSFVSLQNYIFAIYSLTGQLLFKTSDPYQGWDGTYKGKYVQMGCYPYYIKYTGPDGSVYEKMGNVTLIY